MRNLKLIGRWNSYGIPVFATKHALERFKMRALGGQEVKEAFGRSMEVGRNGKVVFCQDEPSGITFVCRWQNWCMDRMIIVTCLLTN